MNLVFCDVHLNSVGRSDCELMREAKWCWCMFSAGDPRATEGFVSMCLCAVFRVGIFGRCSDYGVGCRGVD